MPGQRTRAQTVGPNKTWRKTSQRIEYGAEYELLRKEIIRAERQIGSSPGIFDTWKIS